MSTEEETHKISVLISKIIRKIDFGKDIDKTLNVYTTARGLFINLDIVTETLITETIALAVKAHQYVKGKHNQRTLSFVKACVAYSHITIPTLESMQKQTQYFFLTANVALLNGLIAETDSLLKGVLHTLDDNWDLNKIDFQTDLLLNLTGFLVIVPSNPEASFFQLIEAVINIVKEHEWGEKGNLNKARVLFGVINYLISQQQDNLPYHIPYVDSNDRIFIGNQQFIKEAEQLTNICFDQILEMIEKLNEVKDKYFQELFYICVQSAQVLIVNATYRKKVDSVINKMFKMADEYMTENNKRSQEKLNRNLINTTFESYRKKKEALQAQK